MQMSLLKRSSLRKWWLFALLGIGSSIALATHTIPPPSLLPGNIDFSVPPVGSITKNIQQEIAFHQRIIQQQPTAGLERAALAQNYLKMARATGESSWYLLAQQTAQQSLVQLPFHNYGAVLVLAKIAAAKHDFTAVVGSSRATPPTSRIPLTINHRHLALGDTTTARQKADAAVHRMPTLSNFALRALVEVAQGQDAAAVRDFKTAIAAEEPGEAGSSAWVRTLLGGFITNGGNSNRRRSYISPP